MFPGQSHSVSAVMTPRESCEWAGSDAAHAARPGGGRGAECLRAARGAAAARSERRSVDGQIRSKVAGIDHRRQVAIGRGDQPDVHAQRPARADAFELAFLQRPKQLRLHVERQIADLVEEQRAAVGDLQPAEARRVRAGERPRARCPNSSLSTSPDGMAALLTRTNARACRPLRSCSARAINSLPVPVSPKSSTVESVAATRSTCCSSAGATGCRRRCRGSHAIRAARPRGRRFRAPAVP